MLNLGKAFDLFKLQMLLQEAAPNIFGDVIRLAVRQGKTSEAIQMIKDQCEAGNQAQVERTIGKDTLLLISKL